METRIVLTLLGGATLGIAALLATGAIAQSFDDIGGVDLPASGIDGGGVAQADIDLAGYTLGDDTDGEVTIKSGDNLNLTAGDIMGYDDLYCEAITTDAAPRVTVLGTQPIFVEPAATNVTGANLVLAPSPGERTLDDVTLAGTTGDTLTFDVYSNGVVTQTVKTEGVDWDCDGAGTDIICVCNLYDLLVGAGAITGVTVTRTDGTCSDEKLTFTIDPGVSEYLAVTTSDDTNLDMTIGVDGVLVVPEFIALGGTTNAHPAMKRNGTELQVRLADDSGVSGLSTGYLSAASYIQTTSSLRVGGASIMYWNGLTELRAPADGQTQFCNAAETECFTIEANVDTMKVRDKAGTGAGNAIITGTLATSNGNVTIANAATTFAVTTSFATVTGDAGGDEVVATITGGSAGVTLTILCVDALWTLTDTDAHTANTVDLASAFVAADDEILVLVHDGTSWYEVARSKDSGTSLTLHGEMSVTAGGGLTVTTQSIPYTVDTLVTGDVNGFTFAANATGAITAYSDGTGKVNVADASHGLVTGDVINIQDTTNYNGVWAITYIDDHNFSIPDTWVANDGASNWFQGDRLVANTEVLAHISWDSTRRSSKALVQARNSASRATSTRTPALKCSSIAS